ncbi:MAG TPA: DUF4406 domain-containing protein [Candidatus Sulfotelmatobacter sp.]
MARKPQKVAYIAGPFRADTLWGVVQNVRKAEEVALKYWKLGYATVCPHLNTANFDGTLTDQTFLDGDIEIMKRCDVVVAMGTWRESRGARNEVALAEVLGMEVLYDGEPRKSRFDSPQAGGTKRPTLEELQAQNVSESSVEEPTRSRRTGCDACNKDGHTDADCPRNDNPRSVSQADGHVDQEADVHPY